MRKYKFMTQEWLDAVRESANTNLPPFPGGKPVRFQFRVTDTPSGQDILYYEESLDGKVEVLRLGAIPDPAWTVTVRYDDEVKRRKGELSREEGRLRTKVTGDLEHFESHTTRRPPEHKAHLEAHMANVRNFTEW